MSNDLGHANLSDLIPHLYFHSWTSCSSSNKGNSFPLRYFSSSVFSYWDSFPRSSYDSLPYFIQVFAPKSTQRDLLGWPPQGELPWSSYLKLLPLLHFLSPCLTLFLLQHLSRSNIEMILYICLSIACIRMQILRGRKFAMLPLYPQA